MRKRLKSIGGVAAASSGIPDLRRGPTPDRVDLFLQLLSPLTPGRLLDLGAGHGLFSRAALSHGWTVTAVDARSTRFPSEPKINWVESDVREFGIEPGAHDLIAVLGLLYHLDLDSQLDLLKRLSHTLTIVDTHFATDDDKTHSPHRTALGELTTSGGYRGRPYHETPGKSDAERADTATASWGNPISFWPTDAEQIRMFRECGFGEVLRMSPAYLYGRTFYLCIPQPDRPNRS